MREIRARGFPFCALHFPCQHNRLEIRIISDIVCEILTFEEFSECDLMFDVC
jgi:hypothetical protein